MTPAVGQSVPRIDGLDKVTGRARYTGDLTFPGMLYGAITPSPLPHARILRINTERAEALPGVVAVLTAADVLDIDPYFGHATKDRPLIAINKVRYVGEPVAAVAAVDPLTAREAADAIEVEYEELPPVLDVLRAVAADAPAVHDAPPRATRSGGDGATAPARNVCYREQYERGDVQAGLASAAHIFEHTFTFPMVYHYAMEPHCALAVVDGDSITVWTSAQHPFPVRQELAGMFNKVLEKVRVVVPYVGGGFGSKSYTKIEPLTVALSRKAGRPVRLALSVGEAVLTTRRHSAHIHLRSGVDREGRFVARECTVWLDTGAYADNGPRVAARAATRILGAYRCEHVRTNAYAVYTNTVPAGSFRSIGGPQTAWATETHLDLVAEALGMDPLEIRLRNLAQPGERLREGARPLDADLAAGLQKVAAAVGWDRPARSGSGLGLALGITDSGAEPVATAIVRLHNDGSATVHESSTEIGQGVRTVLAQIAADALAVPLNRVGVVGSDTGSTPYDRSTGASRSTTLMGLAVQQACQDLRSQLLEIASEILGRPAAAFAIDNGELAAPGEQPISYGECIHKYFGTAGGELIGRGYVRASHEQLRELPIFWEVGWGAAEVRVDEETGTVRLVRYVSAADTGRAINPQLAEGQDEGAAMMGIGHTLYESLQYHDGQVTNGNLIDYRVPLMTDLPDAFETILIEAGNGPGAHGTKGMGEAAINPVAPAIATALARACGARLFHLPLTPERVWRALRERMQQATAPGR